jgi:hypothetical protein
MEQASLEKMRRHGSRLSALVYYTIQKEAKLRNKPIFLYRSTNVGEDLL